jgi:hypothetical protein
MVNPILSPQSQCVRGEIKMSNTLSIRQKSIAIAMAALTMGASVMTAAAPAEARGRRNGGDAALALGLFGVVAAGLLIASSQNGHARSYDYEEGYHPQQFIHEEPSFETRDVGPRLVHYPRQRQRHWQRQHQYGFDGGNRHHRPTCTIERRREEGRAGQIFIREVRVCS